MLILKWKIYNLFFKKYYLYFLNLISLFSCSLILSTVVLSISGYDSFYSDLIESYTNNSSIDSSNLDNYNNIDMLYKKNRF